MSITRRKVLGSGAGLGVAGLGAVVCGSALLSTGSTAEAGAAEDLIGQFTGAVSPALGRVSLGAPEIAEIGSTVPIKVSVGSAMRDEDHVAEVLIVATGNPAPGVVRFKFTPMSGTAAASTRIRLAKTQELIAIAKMSDGSLYQDAKTVKVTVGGCGG